MVKYLGGRDTPISDLEGDLNVESDCEGGLTETGSETPKIKGGEGSEETRAVLIIGSFSAYARFLASNRH